MRMADDLLVRVLVSGFPGGNILRALRRNPQTHPIAACRNPNKINQWFKSQIDRLFFGEDF